MDLPQLTLRFLLLMAAIHLTWQTPRAQVINEKNFTLLTQEQGLSRNHITGIAQDSIGYLWIATSSGLNRFDGGKFIQYHSADDSNSLPSEYVKGLKWIDPYRLAAFGDGIHIINTRTGATKNLFIPYSDKQFQYKFNWIMAVQSNNKGDIFILARSGFYHFDKDYHLLFRYDHYPSDSVAVTPFVFGRDLIALDDQKMVILSTEGLFFYNAAKKQFGRMKDQDCPLFSKFLDYPLVNYQFYQQKPGQILVLNGKENQVDYLDIKNNKSSSTPFPQNVSINEFDYHSVLSQVSDTLLYLTGRVSGFYQIGITAGMISFHPKKYFPAYSCHNFLTDRDHRLWIGTNEGLLHEDNSPDYVEQIPIPPSLLSNYPNFLVDEFCMVKNKLLVATHGGAGILEFENKKYIGRIGFEQCFRHPDNIYSIAPIDDHSLLVGTNGPLFRVDLNTKQIEEVKLDNWNRQTGWIGDICKGSKDQQIWIASDNVYRYTAASGKAMEVSIPNRQLQSIERTQSIREDNQGNIWLAGHGLIRYNPKSQDCDEQLSSFPFIKMPDRQVNSFITDPQNNLWINANNNGLIFFDVAKKEIHQYTSKNGLPENSIASMIIVNDQLWIAGLSGLACLDLITHRITRFGKEDGFPEQPIPIGSKFFYDAASHQLFIGFTNTIVAFDPDIIHHKTLPPQVFIETIATGDQKKFNFPGNAFTTSWRNNEIAITIGSINYASSNTQRFAYRLLDDTNAGWQQLGNQNSFSISNLAPGHHHIQVKVFSLANRWPEQVKEIDVHILPPLWRQSWFNIVWILVLFLSFYGLLMWRISSIRKKERAKTHIQKLKAEEYKSQFELEQISHYFSSSLAGKKNVEEVLWDVTKNLIGRMNYDDCMIYLWNEDKTKMVQKASYGPKGNPKAIHEQVFDVLPGQGIVGHVMQTRKALIIADTTRDPRYRLDDIMRLSEICVPILNNGELIGIIDSEHPEVDHFKERDTKILTTIATLISNKIKQIETEQSLEVKQKEIALINQQLAEVQLSALQTQMNPHFIFNCLNSIKSMILENEQQKASRYISKFANMLRTTLNQSKEVFTTLYENMEHLENYLAMEKLRFDDSFTYRITADHCLDMEETLIPTLMIQPLAENAIWHGLMPKQGRKKLTIHFASEGKNISCIIEDNGIGIRRSEQLKQLNRPLHHSVGLSNLRNRIKILNEKYEAGCTLEIKDLSDMGHDKSGSCVVLRFQIMTNKPCL